MSLKIRPEHISVGANFSTDEPVCELCKELLERGWEDAHDKHTLDVCLGNLLARIEKLESKANG